jgi:MYXO-CTERM domain-containing protein
MLLPMKLASFRGGAMLATLGCAALATLGFAAPAHANGRYPASSQFALSPKDPSVMLVRATYGLLPSFDGGKTWSWICEQAVGYGNVEDPTMAFTSDGTLIAGLFEGLSVGTPDACVWEFNPVALANKNVIDISIDKVDPTRGVLIVSNDVGMDDAGDSIFSTQLWQTADSGHTWAQAGVDLPAAFLGLTVDTAPSNAQRVYLSGRYGPPGYQGAIERSDDRGATWQDLPIPGSDDLHLPYIGAVDPQNPDIVYVRIDSDPSDTLMVSKDGGATWTTVYDAKGKLTGFALSPDGTTVAIGGALDGVLTAPAATLQFTPVSSVGALCLTWAANGLYACADEFADKFTAGISTDQGHTFTPLLHLSGVCPLVCTEPDSGVTQFCPAAWPLTASTLSDTCDTGSDAGTGGAGGGSTATGSSSSGCSCSLGPREAGGPAALSTAGLLVAWLRARRRTRPRR